MTFFVIVGDGCFNGFQRFWPTQASQCRKKFVLFSGCKSLQRSENWFGAFVRVSDAMADFRDGSLRGVALCPFFAAQNDLKHAWHLIWTGHLREGRERSL